MQHAKNFDDLAPQPVRDEIGRPPDHQLRCPGPSPRSSQFGETPEAFHGVEDPDDLPFGSIRLLGCDSGTR